MYTNTNSVGPPADLSVVDGEIEPGSVTDNPDFHDPFRREFYPEGEI